MRTLATVLLLVLPALAQGKEEMLKKAQQLDAQAEKLLDQGRRADAFRLLAKAADLRALARGDAAAPKKDKNEKPAKQSKKKKTKKKAKGGGSRQALDGAFRRLDEAMESGDMQATRQAARAVRDGLAKWAKELAAREKKKAKRPKGGPLQARVAALEEQVQELKKLLESGGR